MARSLLNHLSDWAIGPIFIAVSVAIALVALWLVRRFLPGWRAAESGEQVVGVAQMLMTMFALAIGYVHMPEGLKAVLLVGTTLAKIILIGSIFMHLKFEKMNLVMLTFSPLVLALILFFITFGESGGSSTHILMTH